MGNNSNGFKTLALQGEQYRLTGYHTRAIACFTTALEIPSLEAKQAAWAHAHRGDARAAIDDWDRCQEDFERAVALNPKYGWAYAHWADAFRTRAMYGFHTDDMSTQSKLIDRSIALFKERSACSR